MKLLMKFYHVIEIFFKSGYRKNLLHTLYDERFPGWKINKSTDVSSIWSGLEEKALWIKLSILIKIHTKNYSNVFIEKESEFYIILMWYVKV